MCVCVCVCVFLCTCTFMYGVCVAQASSKWSLPQMAVSTTQTRVYVFMYVCLPVCLRHTLIIYLLHVSAIAGQLLMRFVCRYVCMSMYLTRMHTLTLICCTCGRSCRPANHAQAAAPLYVCLSECMYVCMYVYRSVCLRLTRIIYLLHVWLPATHAFVCMSMYLTRMHMLTLTCCTCGCSCRPATHAQAAAPPVGCSPRPTAPSPTAQALPLTPVLCSRLMTVSITKALQHCGP
jgi:hypothetical protein